PRGSTAVSSPWANHRARCSPATGRQQRIVEGAGMSTDSEQTARPEAAAPASATRVAERLRGPGGLVAGAGSRLVAASFLMLFVELGLIRWSTTNILHLAYVTNFVLLSSFLGVGLGFLRARSGRDAFPHAPLALAAFTLFIVAFPVNVENLAEG